MTYYERIQRSIDYMEEHLEEELTIEACAQAAFMSVSGYYRMFLSIVGYSVKDYIRRRRLTLALEELRQGESVIEAAVKYQYNSADSFTRAFKNQFGILPSKIRAVSRDQIMNRFARLDMMEKYFDTENRELIEKYPDIKVIRKLEDMKVACFTYFGEDPETHSFEKLRDWAYAHGAVFHEEGCRVFGYNHPDPSNVDDPEELYGYEVCVTIPEELYETLGDVPEDFVKGTYDGVKRRILQGGKYAVMSVKRDADGELGFNIMRAWKRFGKWLEEGKYVWGGDQYLEEHLDFTEDGRHVGGVDLYISVKDAPKQ